MRIEAMAASASPLSRLGTRSLPVDALTSHSTSRILADRAGEIDVEAGERADLVVIVEGRVVAIGDEAELARAPRMSGFGRSTSPCQVSGTMSVLGWACAAARSGERTGEAASSKASTKGA